GQGITIGIVDSFGSDTMAHDLHVFNNAFGLQLMCGEEGVTCGPVMPTFRELRQGNVNTTGQPPNNGTGLETHNLWALEVALDVAWPQAIAPGANIVWIGTTGVDGTYLCTDPNTGLAVDSGSPPAQCQTNPGVREVGWIAAGGGFSHVFPRPLFQNVLPAGSTTIPATARGVPDIGYQASSRTGVLVYITNPGYTGIVCPDGSLCSAGWYVVGGTSSGSPQWAALIAIADQINDGPLGFINPALYKIGSDPARYAADFYD